MDAVVLDHVDKAYTTYGTDIVLTGETRPSRTRQVLRDLSLTIPAGEITVIVGRSGCGKSTLLKLLAGTEMPDTGTIRIPEGWHSAMLSPDPYVITWTSVQRNVAMACGVGMLLFLFLYVMLGLCWIGAECVFEGIVHDSRVDGVVLAWLCWLIVGEIEQFERKIRGDGR